MGLDVRERIAALHLDLAMLEQVLVLVGADHNASVADLLAVMLAAMRLVKLFQLLLRERRTAALFLNQLGTQFVSLIEK